MRKKDIIIPKNRDFLSPRDKGFLERVYRNGLEKYQKRIYQIGFENKEHILDAGCGFGQWSLAMAQNSKKITGLDKSSARIKLCKEIARINNFSNIDFLEEDIENLSYDDNTFDAIFCYSVIYSTDYQKTSKEFFRVLKKSGLLYLCTYSWGWLIYNLIKNPHPSVDFNPRKYALETFLNSIFGSFPKGDIVMSPQKTKSILKNLGFRKILIGPEGKLKHWAIKENITIPPFHSEKYFGLTNTFEILAEK